MVKLKNVGLGKDVVVDENPFSRWLFTNPLLLGFVDFTTLSWVLLVNGRY